MLSGGWKSSINRPSNPFSPEACPRAALVEDPHPPIIGYSNPPRSLCVRLRKARRTGHNGAGCRLADPTTTRRSVWRDVGSWLASISTAGFFACQLYPVQSETPCFKEFA